ncbi:uncharacterized protein LOC119586075 [Penaeus monodon]|uniref:uncharacterized protein LOC119586075 n=1 Tax=Penaeus monodon TaxID=6687 RepID=UPI0018A7715C|nr:uncharacterized protein LOC119586075 [Penaeus monodon]XP_037790703.1 uncharacterized protein LOC119586075 [Penaeus monodon]
MFFLVVLFGSLATASNAGELELQRMTFADQYSVWVADLQPGYTVVNTTINGQTCYCKVPDNTTSTTSTSTTTMTTKAASTSACGSCDKTITINYTNYPKFVSKTTTWSSPNYPNGYPEGCTCTLTIQFQVKAYVTISYQSVSSIHQSTGCSGDHLVYSGYITQQTPLCSDISNEKVSFSDTHNGDAVAYATFVSTDEDGDTDVGFQMNVLITSA